MPVCADGHQSRAIDYCDVCGSALTGGPTPDPAAALRLCPSCATPTSGRFCEVCGHDSALPAAPAAGRPGDATGPGERAPAGTRWVARVFADREFYTRVQARKGPDAERVAFPETYPERRIELRGSQILIGKRSTSQGIVPEIDLGIAPADLGVSRAHAMIRVDETGALTVTDLGSTNGTSLDGAETPIVAQVAVAVRDGSRIHVGGWTTIAISAEP
ncbi:MULTISPECIES: FHA domain-containing protein [unclassified Nocardia]|uniref:FHA domain-containing protein n=1 Tax=Nocardia sp. NPDC056064 TaxID=3345701 RepID=UPI0035DFE8EE